MIRFSFTDSAACNRLSPFTDDVICERTSLSPSDHLNAVDLNDPKLLTPHSDRSSAAGRGQGKPAVKISTDSLHILGPDVRKLTMKIYETICSVRFPAYMELK